MPFVPYIGKHFLLMQHNALLDYLLEVGTETMAWPARGPNLKPIEHVWDILGRRLGAHPNRPNNVGRFLIQIWHGLDQNLIRNLILSMNRRCQNTIRSRGGNTRDIRIKTLW